MDLSLIPIGAYEPRFFMKYAHVNPQESVRIHLDVKSKKSIGCHWGTYILTGEPVLEPPEKLKEELKSLGLAWDSFITLNIGESLVIEKDGRSKRKGKNPNKTDSDSSDNDSFHDAEETPDLKDGKKKEDSKHGLTTSPGS
jgi:hypothetical protein